jgi:hypothetical protein
MKNEKQPHWILGEIAEQDAPGNTIDLWSRIKLNKTLPVKKINGAAINRKKQVAFGVLLALILIGSLFFVPAVRAFAEDIIQRMGIAFVDTTQFDQNTQMVKVEATEVFNPSPSLSEKEIRQQISFPLLLPTWLPDGLTYVHRSISEYDPLTSEGSGRKVTIEYSRNSNFNPVNGLLFLNANDGPITAPPLLAEGRENPVTVNGQAGFYIHGGWQDDGRGDPNTKLGNLLWDDQADDAYLTWTQDGVTYLLEAHNLGLELNDLQRIAESMTSE